MFDLEKSIADWRKQMLAAGVQTPVPLEELESHLRDEIEQQMKSGFSDAEAFHAAVQKIGEACMLRQEFKKNTTKQRRNMIRSIGIVTALFGMILGLAMVLPELGQWSRAGAMMSPTFLAVGFALAIAGATVAFHGIRTHRTARGRKLISVALILAGIFYAMPLILAFVQSRQTDLLGWIFCAFLAGVSFLFFGTCFYLNQRVPA